MPALVDYAGAPKPLDAGYERQKAALQMDFTDWKAACARVLLVLTGMDCDEWEGRYGAFDWRSYYMGCITPHETAKAAVGKMGVK